MKVADLAKELKQDPKKFISLLSELNIRVKNTNSKIDRATVSEIRNVFAENIADMTPTESETEIRNITFPDNLPLTMSNFIQITEKSTSAVMSAVLTSGLSLTLNSSIDQETAIKLALTLNIELQFNNTSSKKGDDTLKTSLLTLENESLKTDTKNLQTRPPIVTIMGHVDHGKTQLLDTIRKTNIVDKESGGITQHIGAYQVIINDTPITFLDTPGHAAFTKLRSRGAQVTDIAILVVAAEEGVKPQTEEAINHIKAAGIPIIVAINKIDKPDANIDQCKQQLSQHELVSEEWGGDTIIVPISAKENKGIDTLLEMILLVAEMLELKSNPTTLAKGVVIESSLSTQKGPIGTILIKAGTLKKGDHFVSDRIYGKVRALFNDQRKEVLSAAPGTPVEVLGFSQVPTPGEIVEVYDSEKAAKKAIESRTETGNTQSLELLSQQISSTALTDLPLIIKADVFGSSEAIITAVQELSTEHTTIKIIHSGTGTITENDVHLAKTSHAHLIAFGVPIPSEITQLAKSEGVSIKEYSIIYEILDDINKTISGLYTVELEEVECGSAEVREIYKFSKLGVIAGCHITTGKIIRNATAKVKRDNKIIHEGKINSLKRFKNDAKEVAEGFECGIVINGYQAFEVNDEIICYTTKEPNESNH